MDFSILCKLGSHPLCKDFIGNLLGDNTKLRKSDGFLQRLAAYVVLQFCAGQSIGIEDGAVVMNKERLLERILRRIRLFLKHRLAFLNPRHAEIQIVPAVRNAEPTVCAQKNRKGHAEAVLQVYIGFFADRVLFDFLFFRLGFLFVFLLFLLNDFFALRNCYIGRGIFSERSLCRIGLL